MSSDKNADKSTTSDAWIAENPGDYIEGVVTDLDVAWSDFRAQHLPNDPNGGNYPLISVRTDDGTVKKIHAFRTVLYNEVQKRQPMPGERIRVTFVRVAEPRQKGAQGAHIYNVETPDRAPEAVAANVYGRLPGTAAPVPAEADVPADTQGLPGQEEIPF